MSSTVPNQSTDYNQNPGIESTNPGNREVEVKSDTRTFLSIDEFLEKAQLKGTNETAPQHVQSHTAVDRQQDATTGYTSAHPAENRDGFASQTIGMSSQIMQNQSNYLGDDVLDQHRHKPFLGTMIQGTKLPLACCCSVQRERPTNNPDHFIIATVDACKERKIVQSSEIDVNRKGDRSTSTANSSSAPQQTDSSFGEEKKSPVFWCTRVVPKDWLSAWALSIAALVPVIVFCISVLPPSVDYADKHFKHRIQATNSTDQAGLQQKLCGAAVGSRSGYPNHMLYWPRALAVVFWLLYEIILCLATRIDPGIVPPASATGNFRPPSEKIMLVHKPSGLPVEQEVCRTCRIERPVRSGHCYTCDTCVREFDHHCGVLGSCVGERTFRFFTLYMYVTFFLALYVGGFSIFMMSYYYCWDVMQETSADRWRLAAAIGCSIAAFCGGCAVVGPLGMYTNLACNGKTQKDLYGRRQGSAKIAESAALDNGCLECLRRIFGPIPPSQIESYLS